MFATDLSYANITDATLEYANLTGSFISNADLSNSNISNTNLSFAHISGCKFISSTIREKMTYTNLSCEKSEFSNSYIENKDLLEYLRKSGGQNVPDWKLWTRVED
jgi:uncharacterized protein YjbI with pentapeptide repeats